MKTTFKRILGWILILLSPPIILATIGALVTNLHWYEGIVIGSLFDVGVAIVLGLASLIIWLLTSN